MNSTKKKRVLICPLDWGLGHSTRCIPIIYELLEQNAEVIIGADGRPLQLLKKEFPTLEFVKFPGVAIQYPQKGNFVFKIISQLPSILKGFFDEHNFLKKIILEKKIDIVISDSRHGLFCKQVQSVFIIHQVRILFPKYFQWIEPCISWLNRKFMQQYSECWIPDFESSTNLSGKLSHSISLPKNTFFVGALSRMKSLSTHDKEIDVLAILSGPEPQRTVLENILVTQLHKTNYNSVIVCGKTEENFTRKIGNITLISSLTTNELYDRISRSKNIIARSGYSTIMDFASLGINAIFIPTPGQTEQEYLAKNLKEKKICYCEEQNSFNVQRAMKESQSYSGFTQYKTETNLLKERIFTLLKIDDKK